MASNCSKASTYAFGTIHNTHCVITSRTPTQNEAIRWHSIVLISSVHIAKFCCCVPWLSLSFIITRSSAYIINYGGAFLDRGTFICYVFCFCRFLSIHGRAQKEKNDERLSRIVFLWSAPVACRCCRIYSAIYATRFHRANEFLASDILWIQKNISTWLIGVFFFFI